MTYSHDKAQKNLKYTLFFTFFVFAMLTNVIGAITNILIKEYSLSLGDAGLITLSFFAAYGLASLPGGILAHKYGYKKIFQSGVLLMTIGALFFGLVGTFSMLLLMSFIAGIGVTLIQVSANPLVQYAGPKKDYPGNLSIVHSLFGLGSFLAPLIIMQLVAKDITWRYFYFLIVALSAIVFLSVTRIKVQKQAKDAFTIKSIFTHFKNLSIISSFIALFFYVGIEMGIAVWLITYLETIRGITPHTGAYLLSFFWLLLALGRFLGGRLLNTHTPKTLVTTFSILGAISLALALFGNTTISIIFLPLVGFFCSILFPTIYSVTIENQKNGHSVVSGILFTAVTGGAIIPCLIGITADTYGLTAGLSILFISFLVVFLKGLSIKRTHIDIEDAGAI